MTALSTFQILHCLKWSFREYGFCSTSVNLPNKTAVYSQKIMRQMQPLLTTCLSSCGNLPFCSPIQASLDDFDAAIYPSWWEAHALGHILFRWWFARREVVIRTWNMSCSWLNTIEQSAEDTGLIGFQFTVVGRLIIWIRGPCQSKYGLCE